MWCLNGAASSWPKLMSGERRSSWAAALAMLWIGQVTLTLPLIRFPRPLAGDRAKGECSVAGQDADRAGAQQEEDGSKRGRTTPHRLASRWK